MTKFLYTFPDCVGTLLS